MKTKQQHAIGGIALAVMFAALVGLGQPSLLLAQSMADYTALPIFLNQSVPPNVLFLVDMGNPTLEAAYSGPNHKYFLSYKAGTATSGLYAANVTVDSTSGADLVAVNNTGSVISGATVTAPADVFDATRQYYGAFDPLRCYTTDSNSFNYASVKTTVSAACGNTYWDGNFLNWLAMRKKEMIYQVLVGGKPIPAQANGDGTANNLNGETKTGENGTTASCSSNSNSCWRYVKFVPTSTLWPTGSTAYVPTSLPVATVNLSGGGSLNSGIFFGVGDGKIYINDNGTASPFDAAPANQYSIEVDLTSEPNIPVGAGTQTVCQAGNPDGAAGDPNYAGHLACYKRERSLGLFQKMRTDNMHVGVMFVNADTGQGGRLQFSYDEAFNSSDVTNIRNEQIEANSPISEALYEGLCLFRKSQGPCYSNSGSWATGYTSSVGVVGDPFYFASMNSMVRCCKTFVLMISPGIGVLDGNAPDLQSPFGNLFSGTNIGVVTSGTAGDRLDDIAFYGKTHDLRSDLPGTQSVTFYAVNAMGGPTGATLLSSAAKYGGFEDRNNNGMPDASGQSCTYPTGSNLGNGIGSSNVEWDADNDCVPDTYFDASEGGDLEGQINKAIAAILKRAASGTSLSVLATSSTGEGAVYQAFFYPSTYEGNTEVNWTGYVQGLFLDPFGQLREDRGAGGTGNPDGALVYTDDNIVATRLDPVSGDVVADRYHSNSSGQPVGGAYETNVPLREMQGLWEGGKKLALRNASSNPRKILTWIDLNNDHVVGTGKDSLGQADGPHTTTGEVRLFTTASSATLSPYLRADATGAYTADNIINFIRGDHVNGMRDRRLTVNGSLVPWSLGDIVHSTPTIVGPPRERFDLIYGDAAYQRFYQRWRSRRQVAYVGANDGMLHAFNGGYYHRGDDPSTAGVIEHGWFTRNPSDNSNGPEMGEELWGFIPYELLPHLRWFTQTDYTHVYYVDLKPKVTDVKIFTEEAACGGGTTPTAAGCIHPDGWGTILIGGFRFGGSCGACSGAGASGTGGGPTMTVNISGTNRNFYSAYFVLDVTNPDAEPKLLWSFSSSNLGLTTSYPTVVRLNSSSAPKNDHSAAKWYVVVGSGVNGYNAKGAQDTNLFAIDLSTGATAFSGVQNALMTAMPVGSSNGFLADPITLDKDLDFRSDVVYVGKTLDDNNPSTPWVGKMYRLTMNTCVTPCSPAVWGIASGVNRVPTELLADFNIGGTNTALGPITTSPTVGLDDVANVWVYFGTGRYLSSADKLNSEQQYVIGVKDSVMRGASVCSQTAVNACEDDDLLDVSNAVLCISCASGTQIQNVPGATTFPALVDKVQGTSTTPGKKGWFMKLTTNGVNPSERSVVNPTLLAGIIFFPAFTPNTDICVAAGNSVLYGLFYKTGTAYTDPAIFGVNGSGQANKSVTLGEGLSSQIAMQIGSGGTLNGFVQSSNSLVTKITTKPILTSWSQYISWINQRS